MIVPSLTSCQWLNINPADIEIYLWKNTQQLSISGLNNP